jgi:NADH-ubiquinone oxidoreductase chain 5
MYITILLFPLISAFFSGFLGQFIGSKGVSIFSSFCIFCSFCLSCLFFFEVLFFGKVSHVFLFTWLKSGLLWVNWGFLFDSLTAVILLVVCSVSTLVHLYSTEYIKSDPHLSRFIAYLSLFTFFILILVTADNFIQIFVGWEGVGLCSYLLINFWFTRLQANKAAIKAILVNRVGDFGLCLGLFILFIEFGSLEYETVFVLAPYVSNKVFWFFGYSVNLLTFITLFLFVGSVGKSAQLGLHTWLPDAMEGPTPVSALIHAATIVTAGVFLLVRCSPLFEYSPITLKIVTVFGAITAFFAATTGLLQNDLKKVIAYSTCSQLGYMVFACGLSCYNVGLFHLANHAFFKALLFLTAGSVIHAINDEQDIRKIGGLAQLLPFSYSIILIGSLALIGFPFLSGFYSKDIILEIAYGSYNWTGHFAYNFGVFAAFFTAFYSIRLLHLTFISKPRGFKKNYEISHEASFSITFPLFVLSFGSLFFGFIIKDVVIGFGSNFFIQAIFVHPTNFYISDAEFIPLFIKLIPLFFSIVGFVSSFLLYSFYNHSLFFLKISNFGRPFYVFLNKKWFFDKIYNEFFTQNYIQIAYNNSYKFIDKGVLEVFGPYGLSFFVYDLSTRVAKLQSGSVFHYIFFILLFLFIFLFVFYFSFFNLGFSDIRLFFLFFIFLFLFMGV